MSPADVKKRGDFIIHSKHQKISSNYALNGSQMSLCFVVRQAIKDAFLIEYEEQTQRFAYRRRRRYPKNVNIHPPQLNKSSQKGYSSRYSTRDSYQVRPTDALIS